MPNYDEKNTKPGKEARWADEAARISYWPVRKEAAVGRVIKRGDRIEKKRRLRMLDELEAIKKEHAAIERKLRWQIWQRDETGRQIRMNVDAAFMFSQRY